MEDSEYRKVVTEQLHRMAIEGLNVYMERLHSPDDLSTEEVRKGVELALKTTGFMQQDKATNFIPVEIHIEHGGIRVEQRVPAIEQAAQDVVDVEIKTLPAEPADAPPAPKDAFAEMLSRLELP